MADNWRIALEVVAGALADAPFTWIVVGSVASTLRGCDFEPGDLDLLVTSYGSLQLMGERLDPIAGQRESEILTQEFPGGFKWHKLYWELSGVKIDASFIESGGGIPDGENGEGVWEGGVYVWNYLETVDFKDHAIPVPNLCIQLESQLRMNRMERAAETRRVLRMRGYDVETAGKCLSTQNLAYLLEAR